jgi:alcohol dehydrogenase (cytochrome c)
MMHAARRERYVLPQLKFYYAGFEPRISGRIMDLHYSINRHVNPRVARGVLIVLAFGLSFAASVHAASEGDWPSYNRSLQGDRFAPQKEITLINATNLRQICSYSLDHPASFQTGPLELDGVIYITSTYDTVALDADTCAVKWRVTERYTPAMPLDVNRGAAVADGKLIRGTQDGRVLAYDMQTGTRVWERRIADPKLAETVPAAPIAWEHLVFVGNASGDYKGVKGRMYALDAQTGEIVWEQYLVPRTAGDVARGPSAPAPDFPASAWRNAADQPISGGATWTSYTLDPATGTLYVPAGNPAPDFAIQLRPGGNPFTDSVVALEARSGKVEHVYPVVTRDFHDYDVSAAPALITTPGGVRLAATAIKDGHVYGINTQNGKVLWRVATTTIKNTEAPITASGTRFCPGAQGGTEWNGPAYSLQTHMIYVGSVDWCCSIALGTEEAKSAPIGTQWSGSASKQHPFGTFDPPGDWAGWLVALDPDSGKVAWRRKLPAPVLSGVTPTAGGLVFAGDVSGHFYAFDASTGKTVWSTTTPGGIGGGVISYTGQGGHQRVAVATGMTSVLWSTSKALPTLIVYGLSESGADAH